MAPGAQTPSSAAAERVDQLILLTERLTHLVALSAQAFEARRPQDAATYVEETGRLANLYRHESARIRGNPALIAGVGLAQRTRLVRATEAFDAVLARQSRAVGAAKTITEGLVRSIAEEVAAQRQKGATYGPGALPGPTAAATAITLNKRA
ncbi:flagellar basal body protein [Phenylobacterium sp.]|uniref:flagellar basal body protein n=1 Tax=Phenylobacterium sp. TaxID=1871053 RepID=UPI002F42FE6B